MWGYKTRPGTASPGPARRLPLGQPIRANDTDNCRFPLSENEAAAVCSHAELAAAMMRAAFARHEHYESIGKALHDQDGTVAPKPGSTE